VSAAGYHRWISPETRFLRLERPFELESGARLSGVEIAWRTWGELAPSRDNAVVVCHALTGSADVDRWWSGVVGPGRAIDPERDFVIAAAALGSCYGTTGPTSLRPATSARPAARWGPDFPAITVRDQVRLGVELVDRLGVERIRLVAGGSLGGMQALEWALCDPHRVEAVAAISAPARHDAWAIALSALGRAALELDPKFRGGAYSEPDPPAAGLELARRIAMVGYRSPENFAARFGRERAGGAFAVEGWLAHHGRRLAERFDANAYLALLEAMDSHDLARGRGSLAEAAARIAVPVLVVASSSDVLYPPAESYELASLLPDAELVTLANPHGHDAFLIEQAALDRVLAAFRRERTPAFERARVAS
jgi:homoserine O-acetyltransferase